MTVLDVPALGVQIGDVLEDGQVVVGVAASFSADPAEFTFTFSVAPNLTAPTTGVRVVQATEQLRVERPD